MFKDFKGAAKPLDNIDVAQLAHRIAVSEDHFQAFLNVESRSRGFDREGRPIILTEPHVFYRNLSGEKRARAVKLGLAYPKWGTKPYPKSSALRYEWLKDAREIDESAALKSCSWGMSQILGENFSMVGYATVQQMVQAFMDDEEEHVEAMMKYILATGIDDDLRSERWATVARIYNGPGYKKNRYDEKMAAEFRKLRGQPDSGWQPDAPDAEMIDEDITVIRNVQRRLRELGYFEVGKADGLYGTKTRAALLGFRADNNLPIVADIDDELLAALMLAEERPVSEERASTTVADVRATGSRQIDAGDKTQIGGAILAVGGILTTAMEALGLDEGTDTLTGAWEALEPIYDLVKDQGVYLVVAVGAFTIWQAYRAKQARVEDEREAKHVGRG